MCHGFVTTVLLFLLSVADVTAATEKWRLQPRVQREIQSDVNGLSRQIEASLGRREISQQDVRALHQDAALLQRMFNDFTRDGIDEHEVARLEAQVNRMRLRLRLERRQWRESQ